MEKRKLKFNAVDVLLILLAAAAVFVVLYIFVLSEKHSVAPERKRIEYVVEITNVDSSFKNTVEVGQPVKDSVKLANIGTVTGVQDNKEYKKLVFSTEDNKEKAASVEDRINISVTIEADAFVSEQAFTVNDVEIRVGQQYGLILPSFYGVGYCIKLTEAAGESAS